MELSRAHRQMPSATSHAGLEACTALVMACKPVQLRSADVSLDQTPKCQVLITDNAGLWQSLTVEWHSISSLWHCQSLAVPHGHMAQHKIVTTVDRMKF